MRPDWLELDFAYEPCFSGRPRRGRIRNCPSPSSLRNQASRRNDIPDHMTRAEPQNPHAKVAKTHFTWRYSHFKLRLRVLYRSIRRLFGAIRPVGSGGGFGICFLGYFGYLYVLYLLFELFYYFHLFIHAIYLFFALSFELVLTFSFVIYKIVLVLSYICIVSLLLSFAFCTRDKHFL